MRIGIRVRTSVRITLLPIKTKVHLPPVSANLELLKRLACSIDTLWLFDIKVSHPYYIIFGQDKVPYKCQKEVWERHMIADKEDCGGGCLSLGTEKPKYFPKI